MSLNNILTADTIIIGGLTYYGTSNNWAANFLGSSVEYSSGVPTQAAIAGMIGAFGYTVYDKSGQGSIGKNFMYVLPVGVGAAIGSMLGLASGMNNAPSIGAAIGAVYSYKMMLANQTSNSSY